MKNKIKNIKILFKGGYPSPLLNGMQTVNCGMHIEINNKKYEVMGPTFKVQGAQSSSHVTDIISKYIQTDTGKVEISIWKQHQIGVYLFGIAYYRSISDSQSFRYTQKIPKKYNHIKEELKKVYEEIFRAQNES
ncbi:MAG: hypothetical protein J7L15_02810 [Clostridiales bacterium]|nr:hypothetical protein [Clostridiales bacterium]